MDSRVTTHDHEVDGDFPQKPATFGNPAFSNEYTVEQRTDIQLDFLFLNSQWSNFHITDQITNTPTLGKSTWGYSNQSINFY